MHYDADSFSTSNKPTITAKGKAYELYTTNASDLAEMNFVSLVRWFINFQGFTIGSLCAPKLRKDDHQKPVGYYDFPATE